MLHAAVASARASFALGLLTAWDLLRVLETSPTIDWDRLAGWVRESRAPRALWVPLRALADELDLPVPREFLRQAPRDDRQRVLEGIARRRLFRTAETPSNRQGIDRTALLLSLHDSWIGRLGVVREGLTAHGAGARDSPRVARDLARGRALRRAWSHWSRYRRALRSSAPTSVPGA